MSEYNEFLNSKTIRIESAGFEPEEKVLVRYNKQDVDGKYREIDLRKTGDNDRKEDRPNLFYYFLYNTETGEFYPTREENIPTGFIQIFPSREDGALGNWRWGIDSAKDKIKFLYPKYMSIRKKWGSSMPNNRSLSFIIRV